MLNNDTKSLQKTIYTRKKITFDKMILLRENLIMENEKLVLTIDFGTQSVRALIINNKGETLAMEKVGYDQPYFSIKPGYAEQEPDYYWDKMILATTNLKKKCPDLLSKVSALGVTTFRDSAILLDKDLKPVRPMILWLDQRQAALKKKVPVYKGALFALVGMTETIVLNRKRTPAIWIQENEPKNWAKTKYYINFSTYMMYKLTGLLVDSVANQTGHFPVNFKKRRWHTPNALKNIFDVPNSMLCDIKMPGEVLGVISKEISDITGIPEGLKLYASGTDKGSETIGTGCITNDMASISYGTASSIEVTHKKYIEPETFLPAYPAPLPNLYQMEVQVYRGYWMVSWFIKEFANNESLEASILKMATEEILNKKMLEIPPGSEGLVLQPYWGPGLSRPLARGAIVGFSDFHTRNHIYRAIIEGIAFALLEGLRGIEKKQRRKIKKIRVSGGGSQSDAICQITADIFGIPVERIQTYETASLGTAISTFLSIGEFASKEDAIKAMVHSSKQFVPNLENHAKYTYLYKKVYLKIYPRLKHVYKSIKKF